MCEENPLISIVVITYNSSDYVLETLESAKAQSYQNKELIISDDGSTDGTISICNDWLTNNKEMFVRSKMITVEQNTGIPANCNRGLRAAHGKWIKFIAADDVLRPECIAINVDHILKNEGVKILQTLSVLYHNTFIENKYLHHAPAMEYVSFFGLSSREQHQDLHKRCYVVAPSIFMNKELIEEVGGFDETFKLFEDVPLWLKLTRAGHKIHFLNADTVNYRIHWAAVARESKPQIAAKYAKELLRFRKIYTDPGSDLLYKIKSKLRLRLLILFDLTGLNNRSKFSRYLYRGVNLLK